MVSLVLKTPEHQLEVGIIGREGMTGYWMLLNKDPAPYDGFVQAEGASLRLRIKDFLACLEERPQLRSHFLLFVWKLMLQTAQTALANGRCTTEERLARWILMTRDRLESDDFPLTHEFLSLMLGVHRPAVTIALQALEGVGAIRNPRRRITIVDREKLEDIAGTAYTPNGRSAD